MAVGRWDKASKEEQDRRQSCTKQGGRSHGTNWEQQYQKEKGKVQDAAARSLEQVTVTGTGWLVSLSQPEGERDTLGTLTA